MCTNTHSLAGRRSATSVSGTRWGASRRASATWRHASTRARPPAGRVGPGHARKMHPVSGH